MNKENRVFYTSLIIVGLFTLLGLLACTPKLEETDTTLKTEVDALNKAITRLECTIQITKLDDKYILDSFIILSPPGTEYNVENLQKHLDKLTDYCVTLRETEAFRREYKGSK